MTPATTTTTIIVTASIDDRVHEPCRDEFVRYAVRPILHLVVEQANGALERVFEAEPLAQHPLGLPEAVDAPRTLHLVARVKARLHQEHARRRSQRDAAVTHLKEARAEECVKSGGAIIHSDAGTGKGP